MKIFIDSAHLHEVREAAAMGAIDGVTTNPTLIAQAGRPRDEIILALCELVNGPISAEVVATDYAGILREGRALARLHPQVVVKVPLIQEGLKAVRELSQGGIKTNVTLCFSATQALLAAKAGATFVSPFVGRIDDTSHSGMQLIEQIMSIYRHYGLATEVLAASIRHPVHVLEAALLGAHASTLPLSVIKRLTHHPLTENGLTQFLKDAERGSSL